MRNGAAGTKWGQLKLHLGIRGTLALLLVAFTTIPVGALGAVAYTAGRARLEGAAVSDLLTRTVEKRAAVDTWISTARAEIGAKALEDALREDVADLLAYSPGSAEAKAAHDRLVHELEPLAGPTGMFSDSYFIEANRGQVLASTDPRRDGGFEQDQSYYIRGKNGPHVSIRNDSQAAGLPGMTAAAPVMGQDGHLLGVVAGTLHLGNLVAIVSRRTGLRATDDAFLTDSAGVPLTQPRFMLDPAQLRLPIKTEALDRCLSGGSGLVSANDYRGVPGFVSYRWFSQEKMCLVVKLDQAEAFEAVTSLGWIVALSVGLVMLIAVAMAVVVARAFTGPILALQAGAARLSRGDLDFRVPEVGAEELRRLAREFNQMTQSLQRQTMALRESEANYRSLVETTSVGVYRTTTDGEILHVNQALVQMLGYDTAEQLRAGGSVVKYKSPETRARLLAALRESGQTDAFEAELLTKQGWVKTVLISAALHGTVLTGLITDITRRKHAEQVRDALYAISEAAISARSLPDLYASVHHTLRGFIPVDDFYIALYDSEDDVISFPYVADARDGSTTETKKPGRGLTEYVLRTGKPLLATPAVFDELIRQGEVELVGTDSVDWLGVPLELGGRVIGVMAAQTYDAANRLGQRELELLEFVSAQVALVIQRKRAEDALQAYAAKLELSNRDLQEFAYVASHDLQEPLRKVQAFGDRLATRLGKGLDETGRDYLNRMQDATRRMQLLIEDLLNFSRVSTRSHAFAAVDLNAVLREALADLETLVERTQARVEAGELPVIQADAMQMRQLFQNLLANAMKFHLAGRPPVVRVSAWREAKSCVIRVEDNGIGFDMQYLDRLFKPFQRLHSRQEYEGSGMGLAICRRIVERHAGTITATGGPGNGAIFLVTLPDHPAQ